MEDKKRILHLPIKRKWFDLIKRGEKTEEYREVKKYWCSRLIEPYDSERVTPLVIKSFTHAEFRNGYGKAAPSFTLPIKEIVIRTGRPEWGAEPGEIYFVIVLQNNSTNHENIIF